MHQRQIKPYHIYMNMHKYCLSVALYYLFSNNLIKKKTFFIISVYIMSFINFFY